MEVRVLGPLELIIDGRSVDLGGPRQRTVLSLLALNANLVTPVELLLEGVWGESPPDTARGQVQICISALRKLLTETGSATIRTQAPGYLLSLDPVLLDLEVFNTRVAAGRALASADRLAEAVAEYRSALGLWRGGALAGIQSDLVRREATMLEERRNAALEERIRLDLLLGRHQELIGELRSLVAERPLQERFHVFLMLALYRSGRQTEALEVGRRARSMLADEVGVDPGDELQDMERQILTRAPTLELPRVETSPAASVPAPADPHWRTMAVPRQLPLSIADFVGRADLLADIRSVLLDGDSAYAMRIAAIFGPGGVGKTTLAVRASHELAEEFPDGQLYAQLAPSTVDDDPGGQLARFLRTLGVDGNAVPADLQDRVELYRSRTAGRRMLVVLDGVDCEEQVLPLLPGSPSCAVIVTSRLRLSTLPGARPIGVGPLGVEQSLDMLCRIAGADRFLAEEQAGPELVALCAQLPLALRIAGARLASRPHWQVEDLVFRLRDESTRLDQFAHKGLELRSNISVTYHNLDKRAQQLFRLCAVVQAPNFPAWGASALLDASLTEGEEVLERLVDAHVLEVVVLPNERVRRYRFHDLVGIYALERLDEEGSEVECQDALIRFLGGWLSLSDAAHRKEYGGDYTVVHGDAPRWVPCDSPLPEPIIDQLLWWERERVGIVAAVRQAAAAGLIEACWDLALTSVTPLETKGYFDDWLDVATTAYRAAEATGNRRGLAVSAYSLGTLAMAQKRLDDAKRHFATALAVFTEVGDRHGVALVQRNTGFVSRVHGDTVAMLTYYTDALTSMRDVGDRIGQAHILISLAAIRIDSHDFLGARTMLDDAIAICLDCECFRVEAMATYRLAELHLATGDIEQAQQTLHRTLRVVRNIGDRTGEAYALYLLGIARQREGRLDQGRSTLLHAHSLAQQVGDHWIEGQILFQLAENSITLGDVATARDFLVRAHYLFTSLEAAQWQSKTSALLAELNEDTDDTMTRREAEKAGSGDGHAVLAERREMR